MSSVSRDVALFATGGKGPGEGGSGARKLMEKPEIAGRIALILTNYENNGPHQLAIEHSESVTPMVVKFPGREPDGEFSPETWAIMEQFYQGLIQQYGIKWVLLSGWMKQIAGLPAHQVINIHPGPTHGEYGGKKMYGNYVHQKIWKDYFDGKIVSSAVTMHFVPSGREDPIDGGPIIAQVPVSLVGCTTWEDIKTRTNAMEHQIQWQITQYVIDGKITWSGVKGEPIQFQEGLAINIDGKSVVLDGKQADLATGTGYGDTVVKLGDNASGNFKEACDRAMETTPAFQEGLIQKTSTGAWETIITPAPTPTRVKEDIDGVGTKVQIYLEMFEGLCQEYRDAQISQEECVKKAAEMCWVPMLHDLIAMNADDLRDGQMAVAVTNIIDINHLGGERGHVFSDSMSQAMERATTEIGIGNAAGETAVLGVSSTSYKLLDLIESDIMRSIESNIQSGQQILANIDELTVDISSNNIAGISDSAKEILTTRIQSQIRILVDDELSQNLKEKEEIIAKLKQILVFIDFNIGGTVQGLMKKEKLVPLEEGHVLVALYEKPDKNGIIGPRSNGITSIRKEMEKLAGKGDWARMIFEDFLVHIGPEKAAQLPDSLKLECAGLTLGQIATGTTTVFNPFVSRDLLGGLDGDPEVQISSITNVTGNPKHKIKNGLRGAENMAVDIDMTHVKLPQIIEIIQRLTGMSDEEAMSSWNMGVPYVLACPPDEAGKIIEKAESRGIKANVIGSVKAKKEGEPTVQIQGVGVGKTFITK